MSASVLRKAGDLPPEIRRAVGQLLGRPLAPEEHISVMAYRPHNAPSEGERGELARKLQERIDKTAAKLEEVPEVELDALIDEAVGHVRRVLIN